MSYLPYWVVTFPITSTDSYSAAVQLRLYKRDRTCIIACDSTARAFGRIGKTVRISISYEAVTVFLSRARSLAKLLSVG